MKIEITKFGGSSEWDSVHIYDNYGREIVIGRLDIKELTQRLKKVLKDGKPSWWKRLWKRETTWRDIVRMVGREK